MSDLFTVKKITYGNYNSKGSKFSSYIHPVNQIDQYRLILNEYKRNNPKACHVCSAYCINVNGRIDEYASDDGEPSGSSGQPILGIIKKNKLVDVGIFVIRIYGGVNLGIPGLINAYATTASKSLEYANIVKWVNTTQLSIKCMYDQVKILDRLILKYNIQVDDRKFDDYVEMEIQIPEISIGLFKDELSELGKGKINFF